MRPDDEGLPGGTPGYDAGQVQGGALAQEHLPGAEDPGDGICGKARKREENTACSNTAGERERERKASLKTFLFKFLKTNKTPGEQSPALLLLLFLLPNTQPASPKLKSFKERGKRRSRPSTILPSFLPFQGWQMRAYVSFPLSPPSSPPTNHPPCEKR